MVKRKKRLFIFLASLGLIAVPALLIGPTILELRKASAGLQKEIARAKRLRNPLSASDLPSAYISDSRNAAEGFRRVLSDPLAPTLASSFYDLSAAVDAGKIDTAKAILKKLDPILSTLQETSSKDLLDFHRDWTTDRPRYFEDEKIARIFPKLLVAKAAFDYNQGQLKSGEQALSDAYRIAHFLGDEPVLFSTVVEITSRRALNKEVLRILERHQADRRVLQSLLEAMRTVPQINVRRTIQGMSYVGSISIRQMRSRNEWLELITLGKSDQTGTSESDLVSVDAPAPPRTPNSPPMGSPELPIAGGGLPSQALMARHLKFCNDAQESLAGMPGLMPYRSLLAGLDKEIQNEKGLSFVIVKEAVPVFRQVIDAALVCAAEEEAVRTLMRVFAFQAEKGQLPRTASEVPLFRLDPISGAPLRIVIDREGVLVYSPGFDGVDHRSKEGNHDDVIVRVTVRKDQINAVRRDFESRDSSTEISQRKQ